MSSPRAVDSEVTFRDGSCSSVRVDEDTPMSDAEVAYGSQHVPDDGVRALYEQMSNMASVLCDVVVELKQLKEAGRGNTSSTANNENNNTFVATTHRRVGDLDNDLDGLSDDDVKFEVELNKEPQNIDEAVYFAVHLIEIRGSNRAERRTRFNAMKTEHDDYYSTNSDMDEKAFATKGADAKKNSSRVKNEVESKSEASTIKELLARNSPQKRNFKKDVTCFRCNKRDTMRGNVPIKSKRTLLTK
ncbi:hypothetical protein DPMN_176610 [Dreissena polymorpha]|uniref:Uncharacterized protein n=1 Tax=Dreissena polymorpha TaxID=45954 RepID=A0A9D4E780_DREPO|nr:hypothetical protein DPMN_176610 [Dreissena polymorpha]